MHYSAVSSVLLSVLVSISGGVSGSSEPFGRYAEHVSRARTDSTPRVFTPEERRVTGAIEALFSAAERNDMAALDSIYAGGDLTIIESTGINRGWADYRDHHLAPEMKEMKNFRYRPFEIEPHVSGDVAWAIFRYNLRADTGGRTIDNIGRGTAVLEKRGGRWVVRHTHTASRARRPTDPPANY